MTSSTFEQQQKEYVERALAGLLRLRLSSTCRSALEAEWIRTVMTEAEAARTWLTTLQQEKETCVERRASAQQCARLFDWAQYTDQLGKAGKSVLSKSRIVVQVPREWQDTRGGGTFAPPPPSSLSPIHGFLHPSCWDSLTTGTHARVFHAEWALESLSRFLAKDGMSAGIKPPTLLPLWVHLCMSTTHTTMGLLEVMIQQARGHKHPRFTRNWQTILDTMHHTPRWLTYGNRARTHSALYAELTGLACVWGDTPEKDPLGILCAVLKEKTAFFQISKAAGVKKTRKRKTETVGHTVMMQILMASMAKRVAGGVRFLHAAVLHDLPLRHPHESMEVWGTSMIQILDCFLHHEKTEPGTRENVERFVGEWIQTCVKEAGLERCQAWLEDVEEKARFTRNNLKHNGMYVRRLDEGTERLEWLHPYITSHITSLLLEHTLPPVVEKEASSVQTVRRRL